jgi:hypothetical protein
MDAEKKKRPDLLDQHDALQWYYARYDKHLRDGSPKHGASQIAMLPRAQEEARLENVPVPRLFYVHPGLSDRDAQLRACPD